MNTQEQTVSVETMRKSDAWTIEHLVPSKELMRRAGTAIFEAGQWKAPVAVVCGKGNNAVLIRVVSNAAGVENYHIDLAIYR